jgi:hypothetical protein
MEHKMTLSKWHKKIYDAETGIETIIEFTPEEVATAEADQAAFLKELAKREAEANAKAEAKAALLEKLGITEDEARLLLG